MFVCFAIFFQSHHPRHGFRHVLKVIHKLVMRGVPATNFITQKFFRRFYLAFANAGAKYQRQGYNNFFQDVSGIKVINNEKQKSAILGNCRLLRKTICVLRNLNLL